MANIFSVFRKNDPVMDWLEGSPFGKGVKGSAELGKATVTAHAPSRDVTKEVKQGIAGMNYALPAITQSLNQYAPEMARAEENVVRTKALEELRGAYQLAPYLRQAVMKDPSLAESVNVMDRTLTESGPTDIETELRRQAMGDLKLGSSLSADEIRNAVQGSRAAYSARGLGRGVPGAVAEVLARQQAMDARQGQRRNFAMAVDNYSNNRRSQDSARAQSTLNTLRGVFDPYERIYGRQGSRSGSAVTGGQTMAQPYLNMAQDAARTNQASSLQASIANMQNQTQRDLAEYGQNWEREAFNTNLQYSEYASQKQARYDLMGATMSMVGNIVGGLV